MVVSPVLSSFVVLSNHPLSFFADSSKPPREQKAGSIEIPSLDELLRYPIEVWASAGEPFAKPKGTH